MFQPGGVRYGVPMRGLKFRPEVGGAPVLAFAVGIACLLGLAPASAQVSDAPQDKPANTRLLTAEEGRSIANAALRQDQPVPGTLDCSHIIHQVYTEAGFEYPYASSFELYAGDDNFTRVRTPHSGDLIVWPGHVGIVVDPDQHNFSSLVSTGFDVQDYESAYWRTRGRPRFYRYKMQAGAELTVANNHGPPQVSSANRPRSSPTLVEDTARAESSGMNRPPRPASERTPVYGPMPPAEETETATPFEIPSNVIVAAATKPPTREEVAEGISELNDAAGSALRSQDPFQGRSPLIIVEQFNITRLEMKRDSGWARLQVESKVSIDKGAVQRKPLHENVRWQLRRLPTGWEVVVPADRTYVPHDVAVKNLAAQLAQLAQSNAASAHDVSVMRQESRIANLLGALLEIK